MDTRIFLDIAIILLFTKAFGLLTKKVHLPQVVGALVAGIALGPSLLGFVEFSDSIELLSEMGVIILLFNAGLETDINVMKKSLKNYVTIGIIEVSISLGLGYVFANLFGLNTMEAMFMGVLLTATSLGITVEALHEMGKLKSIAGLSILGIAVVDDILGIIILTFALNIGSGVSLSPATIGMLFLKIILFFIFAFIMGLVMKFIFEKIYALSGQKHRLSILSLAFCFFMAYAAEAFGLADITGAYLAGLALSRISCSKYIEGKTNVLSYLLFSPIFFASIGLKTDLHQLTESVFVFAILFLVVAVISKVAGNFIGSKITKYGTMDALLIGIGMISRGEVTLIMADKGVEVNLLSQNYFPAVILMVIGTTLITPLLLSWAFKIKDKKESPTKIKET